ncbi:MAG: PEP-CTERM sorting domain-containing protein [Rubrivivax sp.]|nr:PEP-CTERM sorting domain-containing protein [Rubrivivax sp.]
MRLQHEGGNDYSYVNLSYQFSVPTDLGAFDTVSVLGSGVGGKGSLTVALADADGDFLWASSALTGSAFGDLVTPFASMSCTLVGGSSCDLDRIVGLEFLASGFDGQAYEHAVQEINLSFVGGGVPPVAPIPEPGTYALMLAGLGLVAVAARRRRAG